MLNRSCFSRARAEDEDKLLIAVEEAKGIGYKDSTVGDAEKLIEGIRKKRAEEEAKKSAAEAAKAKKKREDDAKKNLKAALSAKGSAADRRQALQLAISTAQDCIPSDANIEKAKKKLEEIVASMGVTEILDGALASGDPDAIADAIANKGQKLVQIESMEVA